MTMRHWIGTGISMAGMLAVGMTPAHCADDPLTRPIAPESAKRWLAPQAPTRLFGGTYLVGFGGLTLALIRTDAGLILIDGAVPQAVGDVEAHIRRLGFSIRDVKLILSTEPHFDHAGGLAALARDSGAPVVASAAGAAVLRTGGGDPDDPQASWLDRFPPVKRLRIARDGEAIRLGRTVVTAHATPGHTTGSMSWSWQECEGKACHTIFFASSLNPLAGDGYAFSDPAHKGQVAAFRATFATMRAMPCDILLTAHPDQSGGDRKVARLRTRRAPNPFYDPSACRRYVDKAEAALDRQMASERAPVEQSKG